MEILIKQAFSDGKLAKKQGKSLADNPYDYNTEHVLWSAWIRGYNKRIEK